MSRDPATDNDTDSPATLARKALEAAKAADALVVTAESCTGGYIASLLAGVEGLSHRFEGGLVVYSVQAKCALLGLSAGDIDRYGVVSREIALQMARSALQKTGADFAVAVSGNTGPPGEDENGRVDIAVAGRNGLDRHLECDFGDVTRDEGRKLAAAGALELLRDAILASGRAARTTETP